VSQSEVEEEYLYQRPVLLIVKIFDEVGFKFFYLREAMRYFKQNKNEEVTRYNLARSQVNYEHQHSENVNNHKAFEIESPYVLESS
jgi:hypothetical protein